MSEMLATLIGVAIGFLLAEGSRYLRYRLRISNLRNSIREECRSLLGQIPSLEDVLTKQIDALERRRFIPGPTVRPIATVYEASIVELTPHLTVLERNLLHVVHEHLRVFDKTEENYAADLMQMVARDLPEAWSNTATVLGDLKENLSRVKHLLKSYLAGTPVDVFYLKQQQLEAKIIPTSRAPKSS